MVDHPLQDLTILYLFTPLPIHFQLNLNTNTERRARLNSLIVHILAWVAVTVTTLQIELTRIFSHIIARFYICRYENCVSAEQCRWEASTYADMPKGGGFKMCIFFNFLKKIRHYFRVYLELLSYSYAHFTILGSGLWSRTNYSSQT